MPPDERQRRLELEAEVDAIKAEIMKLWGRTQRVLRELAALQDEENERKSQSALPPYRDELPSETQFSLRPTGLRAAFKNSRPSTVLTLIVVVGIVFVAWLLHPR